MKDAIRHLDKRFAALRPFVESVRPPKGWVRAVRDALGMTTAQLARRMGVSQPRIVELEQSEVSGGITLRSLQRAAEALGCRVIYAIVPNKTLEATVRERAEKLAARHIGFVEHNMRLEDQAVRDKRSLEEVHRQTVENHLRRPARLWDDP
jgi:predicted DNA-binding mobile mystery protein A